MSLCQKVSPSHLISKWKLALSFSSLSNALIFSFENILAESGSQEEIKPSQPSHAHIILKLTILSTKGSDRWFQVHFNVNIEIITGHFLDLQL